MNPINSTSSSTLNQASKAVDQSLQRIGSGQRINSAADDAAGLAISQNFNTQNQGQNQAIRNLGDGISQLQTKAGGLNSLIEGTQRIRELAVQSANGIYSDQDRALIDQEVAAISEQLSEQLKNSEFNGRSLFADDSQQVFQSGPDAGDTIIAEADNLSQRADELGLASLSVSSQEQAQQTLEIADQLLAEFSQAQAGVGALQNRFESSIAQLAQASIDSAASRSRISDTDIARQASELSQNSIREQVGIAVQAQANQNQGRVLQLLGS